MFKRPLINNQIRTPQVRLINQKGEQIGVVNLEEAIKMAKEKGLDLIQVTDKVEPPVCKIMEYGKYLYWMQKKEKTGSVKKAREIKGVRLKFNISPHDLETRAHQAEKFLKQGDKVKVEMILRGREKSLSDFGKEKMNHFVESLQKIIPIKIERELKREPRGFTMIIAKQQ